MADDGTGETNDRRLDDEVERMLPRDRATPVSADELEMRRSSSATAGPSRARMWRRIFKGIVVAIGWAVFAPVAIIYFMWASWLAPIVLVAQILSTISLIQAERHLVLRAVLVMASSSALWITSYIATST